MTLSSSSQNRSDRAHLRVTQFLSSFRGQVVTTRWVLTEVADGFAVSRARRRVRSLFQELAADPTFVFIEPSAKLYERGLTLYDSRPDKAWLLTDCMSFMVMTDENLTEALTGDHHFEQAGFNALLKG